MDTLLLLPFLTYFKAFWNFCSSELFLFLPVLFLFNPVFGASVALEVGAITASDDKRSTGSTSDAEDIFFVILSAVNLIEGT